MSRPERIRVQPIRLPKLQHASVRAMGIAMPWIVVDTPPDEAAQPQPVTQDAAATDMGAPKVPTADVQDLVQAARDAAARVVQPAARGQSRASPEAATAALQRVRETRPAETPRSPSRVDAPAPEAQPVVMPQDIQDLDMVALAEQISDCTRCELSFRRTQAVCGQGAIPARVMVVGEAPGELDDSTGEPFAGSVGELLDNMLAAIGLERQTSVYLTTVVKCRPPTNRTPLPDEIASCVPYLLRQLELVKPDVILALGQVAANTLLGSSHKPHAIGPLRNKVHEMAIPQGPALPVVVTYNPLYLLGQPRYKERAWEDLKRVANILR